MANTIVRRSSSSKIFPQLMGKPVERQQLSEKPIISLRATVLWKVDLHVLTERVLFFSS